MCLADNSLVTGLCNLAQTRRITRFVGVGIKKTNRMKENKREKKGKERERESSEKREGKKSQIGARIETAGVELL